MSFLSRGLSAFLLSSTAGWTARTLNVLLSGETDHRALWDRYCLKCAGFTERLELSVSKGFVHKHPIAKHSKSLFLLTKKCKELLFSGVSNNFSTLSKNNYLLEKWQILCHTYAFPEINRAGNVRCFTVEAFCIHWRGTSTETPGHSLAASHPPGYSESK